VTSNSANVYAALRHMRIDTSRVRGGQLFQLPARA
jgi:hypothetical protein